MLNPYIVHILILIGLYALCAISLNFTLGYTGMQNLGHIAFIGIGAYTSALLVKSGTPFIIAVAAGALLAAISGIILIYATKKVKGDYLALATLSFTFVMYTIFQNWFSLTRGPLGIAGIPRPSFFGMTLQSNEAYLIFVWIITISVFLIIKRIIESPFGKLMEATRDNEIRLRVLGKNTDFIKVKVIIISAIIAAIEGSLYGAYIGFISPNDFMLSSLILILTILIVGGIASLKGTMIASVVIIAIPEFIRFLSLPSTVIGPLRQVIYVLILLAILLYKPRGLCGRIDLA